MPARLIGSPAHHWQSELVKLCDCLVLHQPLLSFIPHPDFSCPLLNLKMVFIYPHQQDIRNPTLECDSITTG